MRAVQPFRDHDDLPRAFGDYTLIKPLGRGGMGEVFLAQLKGRGLSGVDKICVIKTLRPTNDPEYERRFIDEARLIVLLGHKNICPVFDAGCFEGDYYLAMEHVAGRELRSLQRASEVRGQPMPAGVVIHIIKEVLDAAHRMTHPLTHLALRVVHRDVSPQNVMVSSEGEVKLIDFGLAVSSQKLEQTAPQIVMGKMAYMAPEQARGDVVDGRTDQFACGVMLYELLSNERYYGTMPFEQMWRTSGSGGHRPLQLEAIPDDVRAVISKATAAARDDRYASCGDMRDALTAIELRRGTIAGSRDVRAAQQELDNVAMPSMSSPMPPPSASADDVAAVPREHTRTFRLITAEGAGAAMVVGLEPGAATNSMRASNATPVTTSLNPPAAFAFGGPETVEIKPFEATVITRPAAVLPAPPRTTPPVVEPSNPRRPTATVVVVLLALVVVGFLALRSTPEHAAVVDAGAVEAAVAIDAGEAAVIVVDAGAVEVAVVDAGAGEAAVVIDDGGAAAIAGATTKPRAPVDGRKPKAKGRELPPLPPIGTQAVMFRTSVLGKHCADLPCTSAIQAKLPTHKAIDGDEFEAAIRACYVKCARTPLPE